MFTLSRRSKLTPFRNNVLNQWFPTFDMPWPTCRSQQNVVAHHHKTIENATLSSFRHKYEQTKFVFYDNTSNFIQF